MTDGLTEEALVASICKDSFYEFVKEFWDTIIPEEFADNWHIKYLCDQMQHIAERVFAGKPKEHDLIINIPPGTTKSTICSVMFTPWVWTRMPSARILGASYAYPLAMDLSRKSRDIVLSDKYRACFPNIELRADQSAKGYWQNTQGGVRYAVGTNGSVTGMHGHFLIADDPINPLETTSEKDREKANKWLAETFSSRKVDKEITVSAMIMQRLHQDDPTGNKLAKLEGMKSKEKVKHICIPGDDSWMISPVELKDLYVDGLMDQGRLPRRVLDDAKIELGEYGYAGQFGQDPVPPGGGMFKVDNIKVYDRAPKMVRTVRGWDKAASDGKGDFTAGPKLGVDEEGIFWILDVVHGQWDSDTRENTILRTAELDGTDTLVGIEEEGGASGKDSARWTVRKLAGFRVRRVRATGDKALRADTFSTQVNSGNVRMVRAEWNYRYIEELKYFPLGTHDDQVDGSSLAFNLLVKKRIKVGAL